MQRAFGSFCLFDFFRCQDPCRRIHHGANGISLSQRLAAALFKVFGARCFFFDLCFSIGLGLRLLFGHCKLLGFFFLLLCLCLLLSSLSSLRIFSTRVLARQVLICAGVLNGIYFCLRLLTCQSARLLFLLLVCSRFGCLLPSFLCCLLCCLLCGLLLGALFGFLLFALATALGQIFFLTANQLCLTARFFFAPLQFSRINHRHRRCWLRLGLLGWAAFGFVAFDQRALFTHFNLNRARLACGISLLDFAG